VEVRLLGELEAFDDAGAPLAVRGVKARTLLATLALHRGEPLAADRLIDILWGEDPPGNPGNALQALVAALRRVVGPGNVATTDAGYALAISAEDLDVARFERHVADGCRHLEAGDAAAASDDLRAALSLCRDEPLIEFAYAEFATGERARLHELALVATEARVEADLALGRHAELVGELEALCEQHPLRERLWELRVLALYRSGRQADALRAYADARERLIEEFGIEPGPSLRALEARVLAQDPGLDLPAARRAAADSVPVGNVRPRLTSFVGRDAELTRLLESVASSRLVTLIGPGGAGKTRLAVEAAVALQPTVRDGVWIVELAGVLDPEGIAPAVAATLDIGRNEAAGPTVLDQIVAGLRGRSLVVVLDNCEHVVGAVAAFVEPVLAEVPDLRIVATSREALAVPGELLLAIGGLPLPAAVEVFADRARAVRAGFVVDDESRPLVEDVCRRLDGLPLAIELAAARLRALPLPQLAELLDDRFRVLTGGARTALPRQQTLRAVVDWSYDLLFEDEKRLFARLSVFAGGWSLEAATAVCSDDLLPANDIIDVLLHLVDKSLVVADPDADGGARYSQLQTLWHYARERLAEAEDADAVRERHARWFLDLTEGAWAGLRGKTGPMWRARLTADWENLRVALDWFIERGDADAAMSLTERIAWLWFLRAEPLEAVRWLDDALTVPGGSDVLRAGVMTWHAYYDAWASGPAIALKELERALDLLRGTDAVERLADALLVGGELHNRNGDLAGSEAVLAELSDVLEELGDPWRLAARNTFVAEYHVAVGNLDAAEAAARASVDGLRAIGEEWLVFEGLGMLASILEARGEIDAAGTMYAELLPEARAAGVPNYETLWLVRLAGIRARQGDDVAAKTLYEAVLGSAIRPVNFGWVRVGLGGAVRRLGDPVTARRWLDEALATYESLEFELGCTAALTSLCWWAIDTGELDDAAAFAEEAARRASSDPRSRVALAATIAAAAARFARSGAPADREAFLALVHERASAPADRYVGLLAGPIGDHFDEPDVAGFVRSLDLSPTAS
jgi:predicted ATPase/DNA-binding SARP family transcriptional activator